MFGLMSSENAELMENRNKPGNNRRKQKHTNHQNAVDADTHDRSYVRLASVNEAIAHHKSDSDAAERYQQFY